MRFLPLIWSGIWRKPGRTNLIFLQVSIAFALFGVLQGLKTGVEHVVAKARADVLIVHSSLNVLDDSLPLGLFEGIKSVPGVEVVVPVELLGATYQNPNQRVGVVAIRPDGGWLSAFTFTIAPDYVEALRTTRTGMIMREGLAKKYGWKVGDHIPLMTTTAQMNGSTDWAFDVVGTYTDSDLGGGDDVVLINYDYFDEARFARKGTVQHFNIAISDPRRAVQVGDDIDHRFANSANATQTDSLRELAQSQLQAIGDLNFLIRAIVSVVLVALLFATATMMMQSIRERTPELAVLKTLGFTDRAVFLFILMEAVVVFVAAAACGLALALLVFPFASKIIPGLSMPFIVVVFGLACAVLVAAVSALLPAVQAARLNIAAALVKR
jgi:putative ABC transport system permease protein